ncbi:hypothetical protein ES703_121975 [subsurface metagenome]
MPVLGNLIGAIVHLLNLVINILIILLVVRALISWVSPDPYNPIVQFLYRITEPILHPIRRLIPFRSRIDFSPMIAILILIFLRFFVIKSLIELSFRLK